MNKKNGFLEYIHLFRGFAILVIVSIHCRIQWTWGDNVLSKQIFTTLLDNGTVLFVFIAGFLFQHLKEKYEYKSYLVRKLKYVIVPYLIISILPIAKNILSDGNPEWLPELFSDNVFLQVFYMIITGKQLGPFWFIPMITIFYLISPVLYKLDHSLFYKYIFPLIFILGLWTFRFGYFSNSFDSFLHFIPVYLFGMAVSHYKESILTLPYSFFMALIVAYLTLGSLEVLDILHVNKLSSFVDAKNDIYFGFNYPKLRASMLSLVLLKLFYEVKPGQFKVLQPLGEYSFGIYFLHLYFIIGINILTQKFLPDFHLNTWYYLGLVAFVTLASILSSMLMRRVFGKNSRYIIGS